MAERSGTIVDESAKVDEEKTDVAEEKVVETEVLETTPKEEGSVDIEDILTLDDLPQDEPLFGEGSPTPLMVKEWKNTYGDIYATQVDLNTYYIWRTLQRFEYSNLVKNVEQIVSSGQVTQSEANMRNEEQITELCLLYPRVNRAELARYPAGLPSLIAQQVMEASSFIALDVRLL